MRASQREAEMVWVLTVFLLWSTPSASIMEVQLSSSQECEVAAQQIARTAMKQGLVGFEVVSCRFIAQET